MIHNNNKRWLSIFPAVTNQTNRSFQQTEPFYFASEFSEASTLVRRF